MYLQIVMQPKQLSRNNCKKKYHFCRKKNSIVERKYTIVGDSTPLFYNLLIDQDEMGIRCGTECYSERQNR